MVRAALRGVLLLGVVGVGYWFWSGDGRTQTEALLHTPRPSAAKQENKGSRVARAKAAMRKQAPSVAKTQAQASPAPAKPPAVAVAPSPKKNNSNAPFKGLNASALAKAKPAAKPSASKKSSTPAKPVAKTPAAAPAKGIDKVPSTEVAGLSLPRVGLARGVEQREPTQLAQSFAQGERVHLFMEARNLGDTPVTLVVRWHDAALADPVRVPLKIPAKTGRYRTWANSSPVRHPGGKHEVSVQVQGGPEIYRRTFTVLAAKVPAGQHRDVRSAR